MNCTRYTELPEAAWREFTGGDWVDRIDVRDFIQRNYTPYAGDASFLTGASDRTQQLWAKVRDLMALEREKGVLDADTSVPSSITAHAGYIDRELEQIVGLQTDKPLKRAIMPFGGIRVVETSLKAYGYELIRARRKSSPNIAKPITMASLMPTHPKCAAVVNRGSLRDCRMPMAAVGLLVTIAAWLSMG